MHKRISPLRLHAYLVVLTLALAACAGTLKPYDGVFAEGVWHASLRLDPLFEVRRTFMALGVIFCVSSLSIWVWGASKKHSSGSEIVLHSSLTLFCLTIGWAGYPYFANGVFRSYLGNFPRPLDLDPKPLISNTWIGDWWFLGVWALILSCFVLIPFLALLAIVFSFEEKQWRRAAATALSLAGSAAFFLAAPNYLKWFGD